MAVFLGAALVPDQQPEAKTPTQGSSWPLGDTTRAGAARTRAHACPRAPCSYGDPKQWAAFLGTPFLSGAEGQLERVARIYKHPFYNLYTLDYDVALLELAGPVPRSRLVRPICLPEPAPRPPDGARCVITGWGSVREGGRHALGRGSVGRGGGQTGSPSALSRPPAGSMARQLQKAAVRLLSEQTCRRFYPVQISSRMLCAGFPQGGVDSCSVSPRSCPAPGEGGFPLPRAQQLGAALQCGLLQWIKQRFLALEERPLHNRLLGTHHETGIPPLGVCQRQRAAPFHFGTHVAGVHKCRPPLH
ncbi:Transmembrane protease serine 9 [Saguinus oedipus]|uniref:Transmembrane protease serine 9 n=1 Tax=Saguinus oedipus TaxID=9490 RepID=A0ABQ9TQA9_SAGOE|nr:Transmembrane protease serine 9 [Saguinus oedipus]